MATKLKNRHARIAGKFSHETISRRKAQNLRLATETAREFIAAFFGVTTEKSIFHLPISFLSASALRLKHFIICTSQPDSQGQKVKVPRSWCNRSAICRQKRGKSESEKGENKHYYKRAVVAFFIYSRQFIIRCAARQQFTYYNHYISIDLERGPDREIFGSRSGPRERE